MYLVQTTGIAYLCIAEEIDIKDGSFKKVYQLTLNKALKFEVIANCRITSIVRATEASGADSFKPMNNKHGHDGTVNLYPMVNRVILKDEVIVIEPSEEGKLRWREAVRVLYGEEIK